MKRLIIYIAMAALVILSGQKIQSDYNEKALLTDVYSLQVNQSLQVSVPDEYYSSQRSAFLPVTMIMFNPDEGEIDGYFLESLSTRYSPCSTFKIPHALFALDSGVISKENSFQKWNGTDYRIQAWNKDQTLASAIKNSVVWYFVNTSDMIGENSMQAYLDKINYGNKDMEGGGAFWLNASLEVSILEQLDLLVKLYNNQLPFSEEDQDYVKSLLLLERRGNRALYGKTGGGDQNGWFVGYVETSLDNGENKLVYFVTHMGVHPKSNGKTSKDITLATLEDNGIF